MRIIQVKVDFFVSDPKTIFWVWSDNGFWKFGGGFLSVFNVNFDHICDGLGDMSVGKWQNQPFLKKLFCTVYSSLPIRAMTKPWIES